MVAAVILAILALVMQEWLTMLPGAAGAAIIGIAILIVEKKNPEPAPKSNVPEPKNRTYEL